MRLCDWLLKPYEAFSRNDIPDTIWTAFLVQILGVSMISKLVLCAVAVQGVMHDDVKEGTLSDLERAMETRPRPHLTGHSPALIREALNEQMSLSGAHAPCESFSHESLDELLSAMDQVVSTSLLSVYAKEDGRHHTKAEVKFPRHEGLSSAFGDAVRDLKCFRVAMKYAHHLTADIKEELAASGLKFPLLPDRGSDELSAVLGSEHDDLLGATLSCQTGHNGTYIQPGNWKGYPDWPDEVQYEARGYGPYPFWYANSATTGAYDGPGGLIQTKWSGLLNAEKLSHGACALSGGEDDDGQVPCTMLFREKWAFLYKTDESECCIASTPRLPNCWMGPVKRDFYSIFNDNGLADNYHSESGLYPNNTVHNYTLVLTTNEGFYFWYQTDEKGFPVEQGEGGTVHPRATKFPPKYLFHQFNRSTFGPPKTPFTTDDDFAVPAVCKNTTTTCTVSPISLCDSSPDWH